MASGSHAKITYLHLYTYVRGTNWAFTRKVGFRMCFAWTTHKNRKNIGRKDYKATNRATTTQVSNVPDIKVYKVMKFSA